MLPNGNLQARGIGHLVKKFVSIQCKEREQSTRKDDSLTRRQQAITGLASTSRVDQVERRGLFLSGDDGQALVEFALTLPVLLLIVTGILSFGVTLNTMLELTNAASAGARQFAFMRGQGGDACAVAVSTIVGAGTASAQHRRG